MLRSMMHFPDEPRYLDATDALAVAYTCFAELANPLANLHHHLSPGSNKKSKSPRTSWSEFVNINPDLVEN